MHDRAHVASRLREIADLLELGGGDTHRARAYARGARAIDATQMPMSELVKGDRLLALPGIGKGLARIIEEIHATGDSGLARELRKGLPPDAVAIAHASGLSLGTLRTIALHTGIATLDDLRAAAEDGRLLAVKGFGPKKVAKLKEALARGPVRKGRRSEEGGLVPLPEALALAVDLEDVLLANAGVQRVRLAGSVRRRVELARDIDLVLVTEDPAASIAKSVELDRIAVVDHRGDEHARIRLGDGTPVDLFACRPEDAGSALVRATGSSRHVEALEARARARGTTLVDVGRGQGEAEIYASLGLAFVTPELREDLGEIEEAAAGFEAGRDPWDDLVEEGDVRGFVHCHTTWSDGRCTVEEMARAAKALGASYITITDHSAAAHYAGGLDKDRLLRQWDEIAEAEEKVGIHILRGTEADILADGALDWPDAILERLDVVVASIHARHRQDEREMTRRLVRAMKHPVFKIWGHPLGRLLRSRPPVDCRLDEVLDALADSRGAIEINGDPRRLDLAPEHVRAARERRIPFVLSVDAHATRDFGNVKWAAAMARRAGVRRSEVLNTRSCAAFARAVKPSGRRRAA